MKKLYLGCLLTLLCAGATQAQELVDSFEVYFQLNKDLLVDQSKATIDSMFTATDGRRLKLRVSGHTCKLGSDDYNLGLSERRAKSAFEFVKSKGEATDKIELFFYGEQNPKYAEKLDPNRRVFVVMFLEDDDRDTLLKKNCLEVFVEKGTYKPTKNKEVTFAINHYKSANEFKSNNLSIEDNSGRKLTFSSAMQYSAKVNGADLNAMKNVKVSLPIVVAPEANMTLYRGEAGANGKIVWTNLGKPCGPVSKEAGCDVLKFEWQGSGYCACAMPRMCAEDCNEDPFGGEKAPDKTAADVRFSPETVVKFPAGIYSKDISALDVQVKEDPKLEYDLNLCGYFMLDVVTEEVFANHQSVKVFKNTIVEAKDGGNITKANNNQNLTIYVPKASCPTAKPVLVPGVNNSKGYIKWDVAGNVKPIECRGSVNCEYHVFEVAATGNYKLAETNDKAAENKANKYVLKTRVLKNCKVQVGEKVKDANAPIVYKAKNAQKKGKNRPKEFEIKEYVNQGNVVVVVRYEDKKGRKKYNEAKLTDLKFKSSKNMYIMRKRDFKKVDDFKNMKLTKCN
jgi:hypothetical protein